MVTFALRAGGVIIGLIAAAFLFGVAFSIQPWSIPVIMWVCYLAWPKNKHKEPEFRSALDDDWDDEDEDFK